MTSPDPYGGSMSIGDPQSFNRYSYTQNDPVNFIDPTGLDDLPPDQWDPSDTIRIYTWEPFLPVGGFGGGEMGLIQFKPNGLGVLLSGGPAGPLNPRQNPSPNGTYSCATIGAGLFSIGGIIDSNSQVYPTFGVGYSTGPTSPGVPNLSYTHTYGSGPVTPGLSFTATVSSGLAITYSKGVFGGPLTREVGYGTPNYGIGVQVTLPALEGTTKWDWDHHRDNPLAKNKFLSPGGRCVD